MTPLSNEELELLQAGLGRRTVSVPEDGDHSEVQFTELFGNIVLWDIKCSATNNPVLYPSPLLHCFLSFFAIYQDLKNPERNIPKDGGPLWRVAFAQSSRCAGLLA